MELCYFCPKCNDAMKQWWTLEAPMFSEVIAVFPYEDLVFRMSYGVQKSSVWWSFSQNLGGRGIQRAGVLTFLAVALQKLLQQKGVSDIAAVVISDEV